jgi:thiamine-monophosphate kinase
MIDSSDGLVRSVLEICKASQVGARIWLDSVPAAKKATLDQVLYGGEEYELVFTVPRKKAVKVVGWLGGLVKTKVSIVGEIVAKKRGLKLVDIHGRAASPKKGGYEHFK